MRNFRLAGCLLLLILAPGSASRAQDNPGEQTMPAIDSVHPFDRYGKISWREEQVHLDNLAIALMNAPEFVGQIIIYAGQRSCAGEARTRAARMKNYLVRQRNIEPQRIVWSDAGHLENSSTVFWLAPRDKLLSISRSDSLTPQDVRIINCKSNKRRRVKR